MLSSFSTTRTSTFQPGYLLLNAFYIFHMDYTTTDSSKVTQDVKGHNILPLHPFGGNILSRRGEGGEGWLGGPLRSPAVPLNDVDPILRIILPVKGAMVLKNLARRYRTLDFADMLEPGSTAPWIKNEFFKTPLPPY
jgi:hypothetical protein